MSESGSDEDFWNVGTDDGPRPARRRTRTRRSSNTAQSLPPTSTSESIFLPILPDGPDTSGRENGVVAVSFDEQELHGKINQPKDRNGNEDDYEHVSTGHGDSRNDEDDDDIYGSTFESDDHSSNDVLDSEIATKKQTGSSNAKIDKTTINSSSSCANEDTDDENTFLDATNRTNVRNKSNEAQATRANKNCSLQVHNYGDDMRSAVDTSTIITYDVHDEANVRQQASDVLDEEGNIRKRKGKLIKWLSRSSTDVRTESTPANVDEPDALSRMSAADDVGYPPKARLKNALYRGRRQLALRQGDEAVEEFVRSFALARIVHGDDHWRTCRCRVFLSQAYLYLKEFFPQAESEARAAKEILLRNLGTPMAPRKKSQVRHLLAVSSLVEGEARLLQGSLEAAAASLSRAHKHAVVFEKKMQKSERLPPASLRNMRPGDLLLHVLRVQAALLAKTGRVPQAKEKLDEAVRRAEDIGGANDPRLVLLLQQYGELLIHNSREQREMTKKLAQVSLDDLKLTNSETRSAKKKDPLKSGSCYSSYAEFSKGNLRGSSSRSLSSNPRVETSIDTADSDTADAGYGSSLLGDDVSRGLAMLNRAVQITKAINRPGSEAELDARAIFIRYQVTQGRYEKQDALRELHRLYTVVSRAAGDASCPALALQSLTVQVHVSDHQFDEASKELHKMLESTRKLYGDYSKQACHVLQQMWHVRAAAKDVPGLAEALSQLLSAEVLVFGPKSQRTDSTRAKMRQALQHLPVAQRVKLQRRHPELQVKPRFRNL